jgi:putative nucleotidyltransferase with HDIG domain
MEPSSKHGLSSDIRERIAGIGRLAAMPRIVWQVMDAVRDEHSTAADLERIIESDAALAAKVVSLANSAYYGLRQKVTSIRRAIVVIGYREMEFLALSVGLAEVFDLSRVPRGFDGEGLWIHGLAVSRVARELAEAEFNLDPEGIFLAGLLHDLGKLVLATHLQDELSKIIRLVEKGVAYYEAEENLALPHTAIGHALAENWNLPALHTAVILNHHDPQPHDRYYATTCLVALADDLVKRSGYGLVDESRQLEQETLLRATNVTQRTLNAAVKSTQEQLPLLVDDWRRMLKSAS